MRRAMSIALAGWFAVVMTMAQACATPATGAPYNVASSNNPTTTSGSGGSLKTVADMDTDSGTRPDLSGYSSDQSSSESLTAYLKHHRLPLVGAQVLKNSDGQRAVVLYGFVGSTFGKHDAVTKTHRFLADSGIPVDNRITVRPELLQANKGSAPAEQYGAEPSGGQNQNYAEQAPSGESNDESQYPGVNSYEEQSQAQQYGQQSQAQQYAQQQGAGSTMSAAVPLLMLGLMALSMGSGGSFAVGPGSFGSFGSMGGSPLGASPYNPYPGFSSPGPYGSGSSPYGGGLNSYGGGGYPYSSAPPNPSYGP